MPTLTLTKADLTSWNVTINSQASPGGTLNISGDVDVGELDIDGIGSDTASSGSGASHAGPVQLEWDVFATGTLDISSIPAGSIINTVEITCNAEIEGSGTGEGDVAATFAGAGSCTAIGVANLEVNLQSFFCGVEIDEIQFSSNENDIVNGPNSASAIQTNTQSETLTYHDTTTLDIALENFVHTVSFNTNGLNAASGSGSSSQPRLTISSSASADIAADVHVIDWEIIITYTEAILELEVTQSGEMALDGGGLVLTNEIVQGGQLYLDGGGSDFYINAPEISGIYILVPNKRDDTWYDRTDNPSTTIDVKIPDPFVSFAFLPEDE